MSDAKMFYGEAAYGRAKDPALLDKAYERFMKAVANEATLGTMNKVGTGMLDLACKSEREAFAA